MKRLILLVLFLPLLVWAAEKHQCSVCKREGLADETYVMRGLSRGEEKKVCAVCFYRVPRCSICRLPLTRDTVKQLEDGRLVCVDDFNTGIFSEAEAERVLYEAKRELNRVFWKFMNFPQTNLTIQVVDARKIHQQAKIDYDPRRVTIAGLTHTKFYDQAGKEIKAEKYKKLPDDTKVTFKHTVSLLSGMPRQRMMAVCAHELGHVWLHENLRPSRDIDRDTEEGFCELMAYLLMDSMNDQFEKMVIEENLYTGGQSLTWIEAEKQYGFYKIMQWMLNGVDQRISWLDLDRVRAVEPEKRIMPVEAPALYSAAAVEVSLPDRLYLKSISGAGNRKLILLNSKTLGPNEKSTIRLSETNLVVRCVEIREKSALIEIEGQGQQELFLEGAKATQP